MSTVGRWRRTGILAVALAAGAVAAPVAQNPPNDTLAGGVTLDQQRFNDLLILIEGQNSPQARRAGARELLRQGWPETVPQLSAILRGPDRPAKIAVARALSDLPTQICWPCWRRPTRRRAVPPRWHWR
jgi:hypothetical protein